jgi:hypothetical protein
VIDTKQKTNGAGRPAPQKKIKISKKFEKMLDTPRKACYNEDVQ